MRPGRVLVGLAAGAGLGVLANALWGGSRRLEWVVAHVSEPIGKVFLRLLLMLALPLLLSAIAVSVAALEPKKLGRLGGRTLAWTVGLSATAAILGVLLVSAIRPGERIDAALRARLARAPAPSEPTSTIDLLVGLVPDNPFRALAEGNVVAVVVFALFLGVGLALTRTDGARKVEELLRGVFEIATRLVALVLVVAPLGVAALVFTTAARLGGAILTGLGAYVLVVVLGLALHLGVYALVLVLVGRTSPVRFFRGSRLAMAAAFSTASSNAALPTAIEAADALDLPRPVSRFVLGLGATMNQNGTALFQAVTVLFLAQLYGVHLGAKVFLVFAIATLAGIGTAGIPAGMVPVLVAILGAVGIPAEGVGLVLGVDRLLDMCRTTVNVTGDLVEAVVLSRGER